MAELPLVSAGQSISRSVDAENTMRRAVNQMGDSGGIGWLPGSPEVLNVHNATGAALPAGSVLGIDSISYPPSSTDEAVQAAFWANMCLEGVTPTTASHTGYFVVTTAPCPIDAVVPAVALGIARVQVNMVAAGDKYADVKDGDSTQLQSSPTGAAQILLVQSGTGTKWAIVRLGGAQTATGTHATPAALSGTGATADTTAWDVASPPAGTDGVTIPIITRLYWSGTDNDPIYKFVRTAEYDSTGRLVAVSAEVRSTAFTTGPC